jgi:hypothetical protein
MAPPQCPSPFSAGINPMTRACPPWQPVEFDPFFNFSFKFMLKDGLGA